MHREGQASENIMDKALVQEPKGDDNDDENEDDSSDSWSSPVKTLLNFQSAVTPEKLSQWKQSVREVLAGIVVQEDSNYEDDE